MLNLSVLNGYCTIQLYQMVGGSKRYPHTIIWEVCGNTLVDECNFNWLNQYNKQNSGRWLRRWNPHTKSYYAKRNERLPNGKYADVFLAREILRLPWGVGNGGGQGDHVNHDTLENTLCNLRIGTCSQNQVNRKKLGSRCRFKGIAPNGSGFQPCMSYNGQQIQFPTVRLEAEAGRMYYHAAKELHGEFAYSDTIPEDEMPPPERDEELRQIVLKTLQEKLSFA